MSEITEKQALLWKKHQESKSTETREKLILEYAHLIKYVAGRLSIYFGNNVEYDDLVSYGVFGLIDAIDKFDPSKGAKFETYASLRIRGAIIDNIRQLDWVPRTLRQKSKEIEKTYLELENKFGRSPTDQEVSDHLNMNIEEFHKVLNDLNTSHIVSLDEYLEVNHEPSVVGISGNQHENPVDFAQFNELKDILADAIELLTDKEKMVISFYYFEELTLKEISAIMKVTESRISQLHSKAVSRLRAKLGKHRSILYEG